MDLVELLTVADRFQLSGRLVVLPNFSLPDGWKARSEAVVIVAPDGERREVTAGLMAEHFYIRDSADRRWRLVVSFPTMTEEQVPIGSKVKVPQSLRSAIPLRKLHKGSEISS